MASAKAAAASASAGRPSSRCQAASWISMRAPSTAVRMSAIRKASAWWWAMGLPKATRPIAYSREVSAAWRRTPSMSDAM